MSLFGTPASQQPAAGQGPSLFASTAQQSTMGQRPNLFGTPPTQTTTQTPSLFNTLANQSQAQNSTPSPFAALGNAAATQQPQTQTSSLFGNQPTQNTQPAATGIGGGMFGSALNQAQPQAQPPTLGLGASAANQNPGTSSLFGTSQQPAASTNGGALPQGNTSGYFDSLLAKSKKQAQGESPLEDLPSLQLGLGDLRQRLRKLGPQVDPLSNNKAQYMLAASGVDPGAAVKDLKFFSATSAGRVDRPAPVQGATEIDIEAYLSNLQSKTTLSMIADGLERSAKDFDNFLEDNITMEWEAQRRRIYEHFGIKARQGGPGDHSVGTPARETSGGFGRSRRNLKASRFTTSTARASASERSILQSSVIGTASKIGPHQTEFTDVEYAVVTPAAGPNGSSMDDRLMMEKQGKLGECIKALNLARLEKRPYPILHELAEVSSKTSAQQLVDAYHAAMSIVDENPDVDTFAATARERQFKVNYIDQEENSVGSLQMRRRILNGANRFLERKFFQEVESVIAKHPREAALGGRPDVISKIQAYVRLRHARRDLVPDKIELQRDSEGEFVWAIVFFLLRSGHVNEAAQYVTTQATVFRTIDRTFASYLLEYAGRPERQLRRQLQDRCNNEYNQRARNAPENSIDPYRMACYKVIGRCDISNRSFEYLNTEIDDWIWLQFNLARENDKATEVATESYGLRDLRASIREIGLKHFPKNPTEDTNGSFGMFFYLQILAGMFEQAIAYLYPFSYMDAVHFAIGLEFYGLIHPSSPDTETLLSYKNPSKPQLNFARMVGYYTRDYRLADPKSAVEYLTLIFLNADLGGEAGKGSKRSNESNESNEQKESCYEALRDVVLETGEFYTLIGDIRPDGHRIIGLIEERGPLISLEKEDSFVKTITRPTAERANQKNLMTDAVILYYLAGDYEAAITIVSHALSEALRRDVGEDPMRLEQVKPRVASQAADTQLGSSLSLATFDDPFKLANAIMELYEKNPKISNHNNDIHRDACKVLLSMSKAKDQMEAGNWPGSLDIISSLGILPLHTNVKRPKINEYADNFDSLPQTISSNMSNLVMWTITCCDRQREQLMATQYSGNENERLQMVERLNQIGLDLAMYANKLNNLKYRFHQDVIDALAEFCASCR